METYTCKKCKSECEIIFDDEDHPFFPTIWCDECNDMAGGFFDVAGDIQAAATGDAIDAAYERYKDDPDFRGVLEKQTKRTNDVQATK